MASTLPGPFERCAPESADHRCARRGPDRAGRTRAAWPGGARPLINAAFTKHGRFNEDGVKKLGDVGRRPARPAVRALPLL